MHTEVAGVRIDFAEGSHREGVRCVCFLVIDIGIGVVVFFRADVAIFVLDENRFI